MSLAKCPKCGSLKTHVTKSQYLKEFDIGVQHRLCECGYKFKSTVKSQKPD
jgi:transcriptional regulator NrdR family protein